MYSLATIAILSTEQDPLINYGSRLTRFTRERTDIVEIKCDKQEVLQRVFIIERDAEICIKKATNTSWQI